MNSYGNSDIESGRYYYETNERGEGAAQRSLEGQPPPQPAPAPVAYGPTSNLHGYGQVPPPPVNYAQPVGVPPPPNPQGYPSQIPSNNMSQPRPVYASQNQAVPSQPAFQNNPGQPGGVIAGNDPAAMQQAQQTFEKKFQRQAMIDCIVCFCCCWCTGIIALIYDHLAQQQANLHSNFIKAVEYMGKASCWTKITLVCGIIMWIVSNVQ